MKSAILVVDDDIHVVRQLKWLLEDLFEVSHATTFDEVMAEILRSKPKVVMVDMHMPPAVDSPQTGLAILRRLHETHPNLVLIGMSANPDATLGTQTARAGATLFLRKPFEDDYIRRVLSSL